MVNADRDWQTGSTLWSAVIAIVIQRTTEPVLSATPLCTRPIRVHASQTLSVRWTFSGGRRQTCAKQCLQTASASVPQIPYLGIAPGPHWGPGAIAWAISKGLYPGIPGYTLGYQAIPGAIPLGYSPHKWKSPEWKTHQTPQDWLDIVATPGVG